MASPANMYIMDGQDLWTAYGVFVEQGSNSFLKFPERKESISNNWPDQQGLDIDTATPFFRERNIVLNCGIIADSENDFWTKYHGFLNHLMQPGLRVLSVIELGRAYRVIYQKCSDFSRFTRIKTVNKIAAKFVLELLEPQPLSILTDSAGVPLTSGGEFIYG